MEEVSQETALSISKAFGKIARAYTPQWVGKRDFILLVKDDIQIPMQQILAVGIIAPLGRAVVQVQAACHDSMNQNFSTLAEVVKETLPGAFAAGSDAMRRIAEGVQKPVATTFKSYIGIMDSLLIDCTKSIFDRILQDSKKSVDKMTAAHRSETLIKFQTILESEHLPAGNSDECKGCYESAEARELYQEIKLYETCDFRMKEVHKACHTMATMHASTDTSKMLLDMVDSKKDDFEKHEDMVQKFGLLLGDLTGAQAGLRDLATGEERAVLARRCRKGIAKRRLLRLSKKMDMWLSHLESS